MNAGSKTRKGAGGESAASKKRGAGTRSESKPISANGRSLIIVESPTKARTLSRYLGAHFVVMASMGHIRDLPERELGVDVERGFEPSYQLMTGKKRTVDALIEAARSAKEVFLATDPDREGEAIAWHIQHVISKGSGKKFQRVQFHEITKRAVEEALASPSTVDENKVEAQQARRIMDRLVGYQVSPLLWKTVTKGLSAGRVQSVALRLLCERAAAIDAFKSQEYWSIDGLFRTVQEEDISAHLYLFDGKKVSTPGDQGTQPKKGAKAESTLVIANKEEAGRICKALLGRDYKIDDVKRSVKKKSPPPPYITSTLQQDASRRLGFTVKRTMSVAQKLYEGLEVGPRGQVGLITYMRTDSTRMAPEAIGHVRSWIADNYSPGLVAPTVRVYHNKKGPVQDAHEAIRPADVSITPEQVKPHISPEEFRLYEMIWKRFVATQMLEAEYDVTTVTIISGPDIAFRATGQVLRQAGYLTLYPTSPGKSTAKKGDDDQPEPAEDSESLTKVPTRVTVGEAVDLRKLSPEEHHTEPPPPFTEASLVKELDDLGIGRPSTYATIISTLLDRTYAEKQAKALIPTDLGKTVNNILVDRFPEVFSIKFTALMEEELDKIEEGAGWRTVLSDFYTPFKEALDVAEGMRKSLKSQNAQLVGRACPDCGRYLVYRFGKKGKFISCSGFPECKFAENPNQKPVEVTDTPCPKCGKAMLKRTGRYGPFLGCSGYPECKTILPLASDARCPVAGCDGALAKRRSKTGKYFYGCNRYPKCDFISWDEPIGEGCPSCSAPTTFVKKSGDGVRFCRRCEWKQSAS